MVFRGPESRLGGVSVILMVALSACGSDPPETRRPDARQPGHEVAAIVPTAAAVARKLVSPVEPPLPLAMPLEKPPPVGVGSASHASFAKPIKVDEFMSALDEALKLSEGNIQQAS